MVSADDPLTLALAGSLPPRYRGPDGPWHILTLGLDHDDATVATVLDLIEPQALRHRLDGVMLLWCDRAPDGGDKRYLSVGASNADAAGAMLASPIRLLERVAPVHMAAPLDWPAARRVWRQRAEPLACGGFGALGRFCRDFLAHLQADHAYLPLMAGQSRDDRLITLPLLLDALEGGALRTGAADLRQCFALGRVLGGAHLAEAWQEALCAENRSFFRPLRAWREAAMVAGLIEPLLLADQAGRGPGVPVPPLGLSVVPTDKVSGLNALAGWVADTVIGSQAPAHRNALLAGVELAGWFDGDLRALLEGPQHTQLRDSLLPYARWFLSLGLYNALGCGIALTAAQADGLAALRDRLPALSALKGAAVAQEIRQHVARIEADALAACFDTHILPFCDLLVAPLPLGVTRYDTPR